MRNAKRTFIWYYVLTQLIGIPMPTNETSKCPSHKYMLRLQALCDYLRIILQEMKKKRRNKTHIGGKAMLKRKRIPTKMPECKSLGFRKPLTFLHTRRCTHSAVKII